MIKLVKTNRLFLMVGKTFFACLVASATAFPFAGAHAHPIEFHMGRLDASAVERVLTSLDLLMGELKSAGRPDAANLPDGALGITAILWSIEDAVAAMDETWPTKSPALLRALQSAGYEDSPYVVAEWKIEAERVLEAYEVLSGNFQEKDIHARLAELEKNANRLTDEERVNRERMLIRKASMLQTTAGDISQVAPFRQRLDRLTSSLSH
jgi:hypothetical protein